MSMNTCNSSRQVRLLLALLLDRCFYILLLDGQLLFFIFLKMIENHRTSSKTLKVLPVAIKMMRCSNKQTSVAVFCKA